MSPSSLPLLSCQLLEALWERKPAHLELPPRSLVEAPETILQIGSGSFLRGFIEDFVQLANAAGAFSGRVLSIQRRADQRSVALGRQGGLYTLILRGLENGRMIETRRIVAAISRLVVAETEWEKVIAAATHPATRVIVSNVTEAGLALDPSDGPQTRPPRGFPGKLTQLLRERWRATGPRDADLAVIPCELVEDNGLLVRKLVIEQARAWNLEPEFSDWVETSVHFASTLVDRIVVGVPRPDLLEREWYTLGYRDELLNCAEPFGLFVLKADDFTRQHFPMDRASNGVRFVDDLTPFRVRKLRILNGPHTMLAALGRLLGLATVREAMEDAQLGPLVEDAIFQEIIPAMGAGHEDENRQYAQEILARFRNPSVEHKLVSICLNCSTKAGIRLFPSARDYMARCGGLPRRLLLGLSAVMLVLRLADVQDTHAKSVRQRWKQVDSNSRDSLLAFCQDLLANQVEWSQEKIDVNAIAAGVADFLAEIGREGVRPLMARSLGRTAGD